MRAWRVESGVRGASTQTDGCAAPPIPQQSWGSPSMAEPLAPAHSGATGVQSHGKAAAVPAPGLVMVLCVAKRRREAASHAHKPQAVEERQAGAVGSCCRFQTLVRMAKLVIPMNWLCCLGTVGVCTCGCQPSGIPPRSVRLRLSAGLYHRLAVQTIHCFGCSVPPAYRLLVVWQEHGISVVLLCACTGWGGLSCLCTLS